MFKRVFDLCLALGGALLLSPLLLGLALLVKFTSPGKVLYRGLRVGRHGRSFYVLKFRSMVSNAEAMGGSSTSNSDMRITPVGRLLRRCKLDELPQFLNVIKGEMSFVGPRPEVQEYVDMYTPEEQVILKLRPGITDWASIWNSDEGAILAGAKDPDEAYLKHIRPTKIKLQQKYYRESSLPTDLKILWYTFRKLFSKKWSPVELGDFPRLKPVVDAPAQAA